MKFEKLGFMINSGRSLIYIVFIGLFTILYLTNPKEYQLKEYVKMTLQQEGHDQGGLLGTLQEIFSGPESWLTCLSVERKNYYLFSIYTVDGLDRKHKYLGVLSNFIELPD